MIILDVDQRHEIHVEEQSRLNEITSCTKGVVNSSHHQSIERLGEKLIATARAEDPIIEAIEWANPHEHSFYLGVEVIIEICKLLFI